MKKNWFEAWEESLPLAGFAAMVLAGAIMIAAVIGVVAVNIIDGTDQYWLAVSGVLFVIITPPLFHSAMKSWFAREWLEREMAARRDAFERGREEGAKGSR